MYFKKEKYKIPLANIKKYLYTNSTCYSLRADDQ